MLLEQYIQDVVNFNEFDISGAASLFEVFFGIGFALYAVSRQSEFIDQLSKDLRLFPSKKEYLVQELKVSINQLSQNDKPEPESPRIKLVMPFKSLQGYLNDKQELIDLNKARLIQLTRHEFLNLGFYCFIMLTICFTCKLFDVPHSVFSIEGLLVGLNLYFFTIFLIGFIEFQAYGSRAEEANGYSGIINKNKQASLRYQVLNIILAVSISLLLSVLLKNYLLGYIKLGLNLSIFALTLFVIIFPFYSFINRFKKIEKIYRKNIYPQLTTIDGIIEKFKESDIGDENVDYEKVKEEEEAINQLIDGMSI